MNFAEMVTNSVFARALALLILAMALIGAGIVAAADYLSGHIPPAEILNFLYFGLGIAASIVGINFGVMLQPAPKPAPATPAAAQGLASAQVQALALAPATGAANA